MKNLVLKWLSKALCVYLVLPSTVAFSADPLSSQQIKQITEKTLSVFSNNYIDTDAIPHVTDAITSRLDSGAYNSASNIEQLAELLGRDFRNVSGDVHLSLQVRQENEPLTHILKEKDGRLTYNHAFEEVRYLHGNIGYLKLNKFHPSELALETADRAFAFLERSDGLIIDLRDSVGGSPALVQHMLSYFFENETVLWRVIQKDEQNSYTIKVDSNPVHKKFVKNYPVWLLTSKNTASASELFAGVFQDYGKAKIVGGKTAGAGYYVGVREVTDKLTFRISLAKPIFANSHSNWEKVGIKPHIDVNYLDAFDAALFDAVLKN